MKPYIDKAAVVAELERRIKEGEAVIEDVPSSAIMGLIQAYKNILSFLDTLEVKEADLEKEFDNYTKNIFARDVQFEPFTHLYNCASHFFELGLRAKED